MTKQHTKDECWTYQKPFGYVTPVYKIDGVFRTDHMSAQYLMDTYNMSVGDAYRYVSEISRHSGS